MKQKAYNHLKNLYGWRTKRKLVVISADDYGNVTLDSKQAREAMTRKGGKIYSRYDAFDALENKLDIEALYDVLQSVKDKNGKHAVLTPFALPANLDFEKIKTSGFIEFHIENLNATYSRLEAEQPHSYNGAWDLWKEGIQTGIMEPQFHGREHLNLKVFEEKLIKKDKDLLLSLEHKSFCGLKGSGYDTINYTAAYDFWNKEDQVCFESMIEDGLNRFEEVYGYRSIHFNAPGGREHSDIHLALFNNGIKFIDQPFIKHEHQGKGKYKQYINWTGKQIKPNLTVQVRNVVFEPTEHRPFDWVSFSLNQIAAAFAWNRPAIISTHRVNFSGHIDESNREKGLSALRVLLKKIVQKWPEVEFISSRQLGFILNSEK